MLRKNNKGFSRNQRRKMAIDEIYYITDIMLDNALKAVRLAEERYSEGQTEYERIALEYANKNLQNAYRLTRVLTQYEVY